MSASPSPVQAPTRFVKPQVAMLDDGRRLHLHHGPIDLIIEAFGDGREQAYQRAISRFETVLAELVEELPLLRLPCEMGRKFNGCVARRMQSAATGFLPIFITPMAAVAGSVADEILAAMAGTPSVDKIYVNNGGDSAFYLSKNQSMKIAIAAPFDARIAINASSEFRGIATSGWRGRSHSMGIADSVSVVAKTSAIADAAATLIANSIDIADHPAITRERACDLSPDSDLGSKLVTTAVGILNDDEIAQALEPGLALAQHYCSTGLIDAAFLMLADQTRQTDAHNLIALTDGVQTDG